LGERTIHLDCDVIQADGGTRTAAITGAFVAARDAINGLLASGALKKDPITDHIAAISVGVYQGHPVADLDYDEDSTCDTDMNIVMTGKGGIVEIQGTAEGASFSKEELIQLLDLGQNAISQLIVLQKEALAK
jgi:ribonuclease PH